MAAWQQRLAKPFEYPVHDLAKVDGKAASLRRARAENVPEVLEADVEEEYNYD